MKAKLSPLDIATIRLWHAQRGAALDAVHEAYGNPKAKAAEYGVTHSLLSRVYRDGSYRPSSPEMQALARSNADFPLDVVLVRPK